MLNTFDFRQRLDIADDADERAIRRAYARELKLIDQERDPAGFQSLREAYDAALLWSRHREQLDEVAQPDRQASVDGNAAAPVAPPAETAPQPSAQQTPNEVHADHAGQAGEVFSGFLQRRQAITSERAVTDEAPWERALRDDLADPRLISIAARDFYEYHVAQLLAEGWQPGHEALLVAAVNVFHWGEDRRRVASLGRAGATLDTAIEQRAMFDMQPDAAREAQRRLIARLREPKSPSTRELVVHTPTLETLIARFPEWLALMVSVPAVVRWRELNGEVPSWRRKLTFTGIRRPKEPSYEQQRSSFNWGWLVFVAIMGLGRLVSHDNSSKQSALADADNLINIGNQKIDAGEHSSAIAAYSRAIERNPANAVAYANRGMAFYLHGDFAKARHDIERAAALDEPDAVVFRVRALLAMKEDHVSDALTDFTRALQLDPDNGFTYHQRSLAYAADRQYEAARADAELALGKNPRDTSTYLLLARLYKMLGDMAKAAGQAEAAIAANPRDAASYTLAAEIYALLEQPRAAFATLDRGNVAAPDIRLHVQRAKLLPRSDSAGRWAATQAALTLNPLYPDALSLRAVLEFEASDYRAAIGTYTTILEGSPATDPASANPLMSRGFVHAKLGQTAAAVNDFRAAGAAAGTADGLNNVCWSLALYNTALPTALDSCDAALRLNPDWAPALDSKAFTLLRLGRYQEAIAIYDKALAQRPEAANSLFGRGVAKRRQGDRRGGDADVQAALTMDAGIAKMYAGYGVKP
jgi:tetratricopeptide (TPR) repeat protein